jgi:PKD repeat protein
MQEMCAEDSVKAEQCQNFLDNCLLDVENPEHCVGGAWLICTDLFDESPDPEDVCSTGFCTDDPISAEACDEFMMECEIGTSEEQLCALGGWYICQMEVDAPSLGEACDSQLCAEDTQRAHDCQSFLQLCLLEEPTNEEECVAASWLIYCTDLFEDPVSANAGPDQAAVFVGDSVSLDGSGSSPEDGSFSWIFTDVPAGSLASLTNANTANPAFTPDEPGAYTVQLTYTVGSESDTDTVTVEAIPFEDPPDPSSVCDMGLCADDQVLSDQCTGFMEECTTSGNPDLCALGGWFICQDLLELPPDTDPENACMREMCTEDSAKAEQCESFLEACLLVEEANEEECVAGAWLICTDLFDESPDPEEVCNSGFCADGPGLAEVCDEFMMECELETDEEQLCALGGWHICQMEVEVPPETDPGNACDTGECAEDSQKADRCDTFLVACLANEANEEECVAAAWVICTDLFDGV